MEFITKPIFLAGKPPKAEIMTKAEEKSGNGMFTDEQIEAISHIDGLSVVNSGAGSGKSTCLVARVLTIQNARPDASILCLAFSKKAAQELKERLGTVTGIKVSTFHSLCYQLLMSNGYKGFTVNTSENLIEANIRRIIGKADTTVEEVLSSLTNPVGVSSITAKIREKYLKYLVDNHTMTFDTMQLFAVRLLQKDVSVRRRWVAQWDYIMVDEAQDLDYNQLELVKMFREHTDNICFFGDQRQSIFSFRGTVPNVINYFSKEASCFELTVNHRSNTGIIGLANKVMYSCPALKCTQVRETNDNPYYLVASNETDEAESIVEQIKKLHDSQSSYKDIAVLYRSGYTAKKVIEVLLEEGIPFTSKITDFLVTKRFPYNYVVNLLYAVVMPDDKEAIKAILPVMYVKQSTIKEVMDFAQKNSCNLLEAISYLNVPFFHKEYISGMVDALQSVKGTEKPDQAVRKFLEAGLGKYLGTVNSEIVEAFAGELGEYDSITIYLQHLSEIQNMLAMMKKATTSTDDVVQVMSIHAAKGLEWDNVFLCGCYDGAIPASKENTDMEEERRLLYTAITRARKRLFLSMPKQSANNDGQNKISRFIEEALS